MLMEIKKWFMKKPKDNQEAIEQHHHECEELYGVSAELDNLLDEIYRNEPLACYDHET